LPHPNLRILTLLLATAGACLAGTGANAQSQPTTGRYLTWANRPANTTPADVVETQTRARNAMIPRRMAPSQAPNRPMMQAPVPPVAVSRGLTPASAWLGPRVAPAYAPGSPDPIRDVAEMAAPAPVYSAPPVSQPQPRSVERAVAADAMAPRRDAPIHTLPRPPTAPAVHPATGEPAVEAPADPMAPRRDARIFQVQQGDQQAAPSSQASVQSGQSGARYYSVHRDAGHRPDPTALPEPVYFDSVSMDLAEPPATEVAARDVQNRRRAPVANDDPSLP